MYVPLLTLTPGISIIYYFLVVSIDQCIISGFLSDKDDFLHHDPEQHVCVICVYVCVCVWRGVCISEYKIFNQNKYFM